MSALGSAGPFEQKNRVFSLKNIDKFNPFQYTGSFYETMRRNVNEIQKKRGAFFIKSR
jgi:hypothetical protein